MSGVEGCQVAPGLTLRVTVTNEAADANLGGATVTIRDVTANATVATSTNNPTVFANALQGHNYVIRIVRERYGVVGQAGYGIAIDSAAGTISFTMPNGDTNIVAAMRPTGIRRAEWTPKEVEPMHNSDWGNITSFVANNSLAQLRLLGTADTLATMEIDTFFVPNGTKATIKIYHGTAAEPSGTAADIGITTQYDNAAFESLAPKVDIIDNLEVRNGQVVVSRANVRPTHRFTQRSDRPQDLWGAPRRGAGAGEDAHDPFYYFSVQLTTGGPFGRAGATSDALRLKYWHVGAGDAVADMDAYGNLGSLSVARAFARGATNAVNSGRAAWFNQGGPEGDVRAMWGSLVRNTFAYCHLFHGTVQKPPGYFQKEQSAFAIGGARAIGTATDEYRCPLPSHTNFGPSKDAGNCTLTCRTALVAQARRDDEPHWAATCPEHADQLIPMTPGRCPAACGQQRNVVTRWGCDNHGRQQDPPESHLCAQPCDDPLVDGGCPRHDGSRVPHPCAMALVQTQRYPCGRHPANEAANGGPCDSVCDATWVETDGHEWTCQHHDDQRYQLQPGVCNLDCNKVRTGGRRQAWSCNTHPEVIRRYPTNCPVCNTALLGPAQLAGADAQGYTIIWGSNVLDTKAVWSAPKYLALMFSCSAGQEDSLIKAFHARGTWYVGAFQVTIKADDADTAMQRFFARWGRYRFNPRKIEESWTFAFSDVEMRGRMQPILTRSKAVRL